MVKPGMAAIIPASVTDKAVMACCAIIGAIHGDIDLLQPIDKRAVKGRCRSIYLKSVHDSS
jgi:hypothetical protein